MTGILRSGAKFAHIWIGIPFGLLFCLMGLSGSLILYRDAIETALRPSWKATKLSNPASVLTEGDRNIRQRWPDAMPQYGPGHPDMVAELRAGLPPTLVVAGGYLDGIGVPACIAAAGRAVTSAIRAVEASVAR